MVSMNTDDWLLTLNAIAPWIAPRMGGKSS